MREIFRTIIKFLKDRFNLSEDKADEYQIAANIKKDVNFKGANLWTLIFAIMIASGIYPGSKEIYYYGINDFMK